MYNFYSKIIKIILTQIIILNYITNIIVAQPNNNDQGAKPHQPKINAKPFEGSIKFIQQTLSDTLCYTYHIKNNMVRLDIHENIKGCEDLDNSLLFNLRKKTITALNPKRKIYISVPTKPYVDIKNDDFKIIKSKNNKNIHDYKCYQWRVKNKSKNTEISYWVAYDNFLFFEDFLKLWNRTEKSALFFLQISNIKGYFPMLSVERTLLRDEKMRLSVTEITKAKLDDSLFKIPEDFKSYDH